jgi:quinol monooxygenase YgiN
LRGGSGDLLCADGGQAGQAEAVQELLLTNPRRIEQGEQGNLAFGVHRSTDNPNEFWLYETWVDEAAVAAHESGAAFKQYKEALRGPGRARECAVRQHRADQGAGVRPAGRGHRRQPDRISLRLPI